MSDLYIPTYFAQKNRWISIANMGRKNYLHTSNLATQQNRWIFLANMSRKKYLHTAPTLAFPFSLV